MLCKRLSQARVPAINCDDRGWATYSGTPVPTNGGNFDPRRLYMLTDALTRASATSLFKLSVLVDTAGILAMIEARDGSTYSPNLATKSDWTNVWWTRTINAFFSTVPSSYWFQINGRPAIFLWSVNYFSNYTGNGSRLLQYLESSFISTYGQDPVFVLDQSWFGDSSITNLSSVVADNSWFNGARAGRPPHTRDIHAARQFRAGESRRQLRSRATEQTDLGTMAIRLRKG